MSWENLEGGQEVSQHSGEAYRQRVEAYLESGEFLSTGDPYSGTSDIRLTRPAHNEEKVFRVETKNTKASLTAQAVIDEIARQFIDFHVSSEEFEFYFFAPDYADQPRWKAIFRDRTRKEEEVRRFYNDVCEKHNLNTRETEKFDDLDFDDFWQFLEKIGIKKAGYERLAELIDENESQERRQKKWEFYIRENEAVQESEELIPNFVRIAEFPSKVWISPSLAADHHEVYDENPRYLPIWFEGSNAYSLIQPTQMRESLKKFVDVDNANTLEFMEWMEDADSQSEQCIVKTLLNRQLTWRGTQLNDHCTAVRHDRIDKLIFTRRDPGPVQQTLGGEVKDSNPERSQKVDGYLVTKDMGTSIAHRFGNPLVKRYAGEYYVFIRTGWLFTQNGRGEQILEGKRADDEHNKLDKNTLDRTPNQRAQLRQWWNHLKMAVESASHARTSEMGRLDRSQSMRFELPSGMELPERPPKNTEERDILMEGGRIARH